ncbi:oxidoreductase domain-containing protein [Arthrobacter sp. PAMC 25486]|nr:oxidoreductase domain-containing protein [Arthrobacter sp. PAMC 25486]
MAVARRSPSRAQSFAASFGPEVRAHASYPELFADPGVGALYVATLHTSHVALAIAALEAGKHVICEKPASVDHAGAMAVIEAARRSGRYYAEGFMCRFHQQTIRLAELVRDGATGDVQHIEFTLSFASELPAGHRLMDANLAGVGILDVGGYPVSTARLLAGAAGGQLCRSCLPLGERHDRSGRCGRMGHRCPRVPAGHHRAGELRRETDREK